MINELAIEMLEHARNKNWKIATAESCTGGLISASLTEIAGSSDVFECGFVTYSNDAKMQMLGVSHETLSKHGAVSEQTAHEMALGAIENSFADIAVSVTGIAGPGSSDHKPEGRVCFGLAVKNQPTITQTMEFGAIGRQNVRLETVQFALNLVITAAKTIK